MAAKDPKNDNRPFAAVLKGVKITKKKDLPPLVAKAVSAAAKPDSPAEQDETAFFRAMDFSTPYFKVRQALVVPAKSTVTNIEEMKGKTLGAQISTTGHFAIKKVAGVKDKSYDEVGLAFEDLFNGRIDGVVCDDPVAAQYALQNEKYKGALKIACIIEAGDEYYGIAVKKGDTEDLDLINKGIAAVQKKGIDKELLKKWIGGGK